MVGAEAPTMIFRSSSKRRRWSLRAGVLIALGVSAVPATGAVIVQNFMTAEVNRAVPCLKKIAGLDAGATTDPVARDLTLTTNTTEGTPLLNERVTIQGYRGDRLIATDSIRVQNTCAYNVRVFLRAEPGLAATTTSGDWRDLHMKIYLGKITMATASTAAASGTDFSIGTEWDSAPISITKSAASVAPFTGVVATASTSTVDIAGGATNNIQIGYLVDTGSAAGSPAAGVTATLNYTVNATRI
jgi:hypothetical protein